MFLNEFITQILKTSTLEWLAVLTGVLYLIFAVNEKVICWLFGILSSLIYIFISFENQLFLDLGLQTFYVIAGIYGWINWKKPKVSISIREHKIQTHVFAIIGLSVLACGLGYLFDRYTSQFNPYLDAFITIFSFYATFLVTQKILSNWLYWIVINLLGIFLFGTKGLYLTSLLYLINTVMAIIGFIKWKKTLKIKKQ